MANITVTPAYGRDYKSRKALEADWLANQDFIIAEFLHPYDGKPINRSQAQESGITVYARYNGLTRITPELP